MDQWTKYSDQWWYDNWLDTNRRLLLHLGKNFHSIVSSDRLSTNVTLQVDVYSSTRSSKMLLVMFLNPPSSPKDLISGFVRN